jgi:predicted aconitase with swiveling domain
LTARPIIPGHGEGPALVSTEAISFWGDVDPATGRVTNPRHPLRGERLGGRVLVYPSGRGSCTTSNILLELIRTRQALVGEALYGRTIPLVTLDADAFERIQPGDWLVVDAVTGAVTRSRP